MDDNTNNNDGSANSIRQSRPRGSLTGAKNLTTGKRDGPTMATPNRSNLSFGHAFEIANSPTSQRSTVNEKIAIGGQSLINLGFPGVGTGVALARAAAMTQGSKTPASPSTSGRGTNSGKGSGVSPRRVYAEQPVSPFGDDGGNEDLFKLGTNGPAPSAAPNTAASEKLSLAQQQTNAALKKRRQSGGFSLFGSGGAGGSGFLS